MTDGHGPDAEPAAGPPADSAEGIGPTPAPAGPGEDTPATGPTPEELRDRSPDLWVFGAIVAVAAVVDILTKELAFSLLDARYDPDRPGVVYSDIHHVIPNILQFKCWLNTGAAWSVGSGSNGLFVVLTVVITAGLLWLRTRIRHHGALAHVSLALVVGGSFGNLYDRLTVGAVRDFIDFLVIRDGEEIFHFPTFNLADTWISVGAILLGWHLVFRAERCDNELKEAVAAQAGDEDAATDARAPDRPEGEGP